MSSPDPRSETSVGGKVVFSGVPTVVALANSAIVINLGGGPTDDKPDVTLETPPDPDRVSSFLNLRVKDIAAVLRGLERARRGIPDSAEAARVRDPLLRSRPRRPSDRGGADHGPGRGLGARSVARVIDLPARGGIVHGSRGVRAMSTTVGGATTIRNG
jgi:hypothetical protein